MIKVTAIYKHILSFTRLVRQDVARRSVERQLARLSDRMLNDIGLDRGSISAAARQAVGIDPSAPTLSEFLRDRIMAIGMALLAWHRRNRLRGELAMLDDRMLADIGVSRHELNELVRDKEITGGKSDSHQRGAGETQTLPLALWGRARIVQDGILIQQANNTNDTKEENRAA